MSALLRFGAHWKTGTRQTLFQNFTILSLRRVCLSYVLIRCIFKNLINYLNDYFLFCFVSAQSQKQFHKKIKSISLCLPPKTNPKLFSLDNNMNMI